MEKGFAGFVADTGKAGASQENMVWGLQGVATKVACRGHVAEATIAGEGIVKLGRARVELNKRRIGRGCAGVWVLRGRVVVVK